jgi:hypothetical protein
MIIIATRHSTSDQLLPLTIDLLAIVVATRHSTADQSVTHYRLLSTVIATRTFPRSILFFGDTKR